MSVRRVSIIARTDGIDRIIVAWRQYYCSGAVGQLLVPAPVPTRVTAAINGVNTQFRPSSFALGNVVLVQAVGGDFRVAFFDQGLGRFLPAIASLMVLTAASSARARRYGIRSWPT